MCGIVCYIGAQPALPILLEGLRRLEYRGYDSAGLTIVGNGSTHHHRAIGKIQQLEKQLDGKDLEGTAGIAHTRWATHGKPSIENAHPQVDCSSRFFVAHNGIVENYSDLKTELLSRGHQFRSETDTEVIAHLLEEYYEGDLEGALIRTLEKLRGAFGLGIVSADHPDTILAFRRGSPIVLGVGGKSFFAASDLSALVNYTRDVVYLHDDDVATLSPDGYKVVNIHKPTIFRKEEIVDWDVRAAEKGSFPHFMLKEIYEQPEVIRNAMRGRLLEAEGTARLGGLDPVADQLRKMDHLIIVSCGTSYYAGLLGRCILEWHTDLAVEVDLASEFRYRRLNLKKGTSVLAISQSGETADTLAAVREARRKGVPVLGLINVVGSTIARETDAGIYNHAGPEVGVASTKSFISQVTILYLIALLLARHQRMSVSEGQAFIRELESLPEKIEWLLLQSEKIRQIAQRYSHYENFLFLGRKFNYPVALEGALKLKEISYLHAEAYAAGEMKHGPIALIDSQFPSVCLAPRDTTYEKMVSNIQEVKARGGRVIAVTTEGDKELAGLCDDVIEIPPSEEPFTPILAVVPLQLLSYYIAEARSCEIDRPRNLAKSVTVE